MDKLSVIILTKNEEKNILDCLEGVLFAHEIIIIDDYSDDRTCEVAESLGLKNTKIYNRKLDNNFSEQRNYGLKKARNEWVFFLDADERVSEDLLKEITEIIAASDKQGFYIRRRDVMWGRKLMHGETGDIKLLRLAKTGAGEWLGDVHEEWNIKGTVGILKNELMHYPHQSVREFLSKINFYSSLRALELKNNQAKVALVDIILYPKVKFLLNYFLKLGLLDGTQGLLVALMMSFHSFLVRGKLWLLKNVK